MLSLGPGEQVREGSDLLMEALTHARLESNQAKKIELVLLRKRAAGAEAGVRSNFLMLSDLSLSTSCLRGRLQDWNDESFELGNVLCWTENNRQEKKGPLSSAAP